MGYINIPKLVGGGDAPIIPARDLPSDWAYYKTLKANAKDQAYLFYQGQGDTFYLSNVTNTTVTVYGGSNGTTPLYQWQSDGRWYHWDATQNAWVLNTTQFVNTSAADFTKADLDNFPRPRGLRFSDLTGKQVTNDENIGTTQLFTVIVSRTNNSAAASYLTKTSTEGASSNYGVYSFPVVAYSGYTSGLVGDTAYAYNLEFIDFVDFNYNPNALTNKYHLKKLEYPDTVTSIGQMRFNYALQEFKIPTGVKPGLPSYCLSDNLSLRKITFHNELTNIPTYAFSSCVSLRELENTNFTYIGSYAFNYCYSLQEIDASHVTTIDNNAFYYCSALKKVKLNNSLTTIPANCFYGCYSLADINVPTSLTTVGNSAFYYCYVLPEFIAPSTLTSLGQSAFRSCYSLTRVSLPNSVTTIDNRTFNDCNDLRQVQLGNAVTNIGQHAFNGCRSLKNITLPDTLKIIDLSSFANCENLEYLVIPASVITIGTQAFISDSAVLYYKFKGAPASLSNANAFSSPNTYMKMLIPYEYITDYHTATNWNTTSLNLVYRYRGFKSFQQGDTLPAQTQDGLYNLTWFENLNDIIRTTYNGIPDVPPITVAPYDGEFYCTIQAVS